MPLVMLLRFPSLDSNYAVIMHFFSRKISVFRITIVWCVRIDLVQVLGKIFNKITRCWFISTTAALIVQHRQVIALYYWAGFYLVFVSLVHVSQLPSSVARALSREPAILRAFSKILQSLEIPQADIFNAKTSSFKQIRRYRMLVREWLLYHKW